MQPFPPLQVLARLRGDSIAQVWLDPFGVRLLFESKVQIYVEEALEHVERDGTLWSYDCQSEDRRPLVLQRLLYKPIRDVQRDDYRLTLLFEDGVSLSVLAREGQYESGHLQMPEGTFDVF